MEAWHTELLTRARERRLEKVAAAYAVSGWLAVQVAAIALPAFHAPDWLLRWFIAAALLGFPASLAIAWIWNRERLEAVTHLSRLDIVLLGTISAIAFLTLGELAWHWSSAEPSASNSTESKGIGATALPIAKTPEASIAVLPFEDLSPGKDQQYFSDGMAEEILNALTQVNGLKVASRTSSFQYRNKAVGAKQIANELNVRNLLEGSVRKAGSQIRVTAQLIDAQTDTHLWSHDFDRPLKAQNIFKIQDAIAGAIVDALRPRIGAQLSFTTAHTGRTDSTEAYDDFLRAHELYLRRGLELKDAVLLYEQSVRADPTFSRAWAELAAAASAAPSWDVSDRDYRSISLDAAKRAIMLDPNQALGYAAIGSVEQSITFPPNWELARKMLDKALALDRRNPQILVFRGLNGFYLRDFARSEAEFRQCLRIDPNYLICRFILGLLKIAQGDESAALDDLAIVNSKGFTAADFEYVPLLLRRGDRVGAANVALAGAHDPHLAERLIGALSENSPAKQVVALEHLKSLIKGDTDLKHFLMLRTAQEVPITDYDATLRYEIFHVWLPDYAAYRRTKNFKDMMRAFGIEPYWRRHGFPPQCRPLGAKDFTCQ